MTAPSGGSAPTTSAARPVVVTLRWPEIRKLASSDIAARAILRAASRALSVARANAPVSRTGSHGRRPGYLKRKIRVRFAQDVHGVYADLMTAARAPGGFPYGRLMEAKRPYLRPAVEQQAQR